MEYSSPIKPEIKEFVRSYWKFSPIIRQMIDLMQKNEVIQNPNLETEMEGLKDSHFELIKSKYGEGIMEEWERIDNLRKKNTSLGGGNELYSFFYKTGLSDECPAETALRSHFTLESMLSILEKRSDEFTLVDCGSGDGRTAIGLAKYLGKLKKITAVDWNKDALDRMEYFMGTLSREDQNIVRPKIIPVNGDFIKRDLQKAITSNGSQLFDVALSAYNEEVSADIGSLALTLVKPSGSVLSYCPINCNYPTYQCHFDLHSNIGIHYPVKIDIVDRRMFWPEIDILAIEIKREN